MNKNRLRDMTVILAVVCVLDVQKVKDTTQSLLHYFRVLFLINQTQQTKTIVTQGPLYVKDAELYFDLRLVTISTISDNCNDIFSQQ